MEVVQVYFEDVYVLKPRLFEDDRGYFYESFNLNNFKKAINNSQVEFVQDNQSLSKQGVIRGLHLQAPPFAQGKLVRVIQGKALDVFLDLRKNSATYGKWHSQILTPENRLQVYIPEGFAHGFVALEENTLFLYKCTNYYNKESEMSIAWDDSDLNIDWKTKPDHISDKDQRGVRFNEFKSPFD